MSDKITSKTIKVRRHYATYNGKTKAFSRKQSAERWLCWQYFNDEYSWDVQEEMSEQEKQRSVNQIATEKGFEHPYKEQWYCPQCGMVFFESELDFPMRDCISSVMPLPKQLKEEGMNSCDCDFDLERISPASTERER